MIVGVMKKFLMFFIFHLVLKQMIKENYRKRKAGLIADKWYWGDILAARYGYFVSAKELGE